MADLRVVGIPKAKPGSEQVVQDALVALVEPTRAEAGCLSYELLASATEPGTFFTIETWTDGGELDAHMQTPHVQQALAAAGDHLAAAPDIQQLHAV